MSNAIKDAFRTNRPPGVPGRLDKYLADPAQELRRVLQRTQRTFDNASVRFPEEGLGDLSAVLVEFGEDIHADIGLWRSFENYNREFFGTPLPLALDLVEAPLAPFDARRLQHLLWTVWACVEPNDFPSPAHPNLIRLAEIAGAFLAERFTPLPRDSGVKTFLTGASIFGWEIKRKLVWLGTKSYLFRRMFAQFASKQEDGASVGVADDFICQESTGWSGLGAIDILAGALDVPAEDRATLRSWYERHVAFYRVLSLQNRGGETEFIQVRNLVNRQPYIVRMNVADCPFQPGMVVFGSLTPWRGEWYWSGEQRTYPNMPQHEEANLRKKMLEQQSGLAYRYCPAEASRARESNRRLHQEFLAYCGGDLVVYPNGLALAAAEQKRLEKVWRDADPEHIRRVMREKGLEHPRPPMRFPREFLDHEEGIGAFYNPDEGQEFMLGFNHLLSGLRKQGEALTEVERESLWHFVTDRSSSPAFVHRVVRDHGAASLAERFQLRHLPVERALSFLLRCHKGRFYRNRYPSVSLVDADQA